MFEDYARTDAVELAARVRAGELRAEELLEAAIARAEALNPRLNAIVWKLYESARRQARAPLSGPLAGVPFLVKDLFQEVAGEPFGWGNRALRDSGLRAEVDSEVVARWRRAGLLIFGRTNAPEFGSKGITEPLAFGPTRNPWDLARTPGGSSGGSAAAVAAGIVPLAGANDGGGSIRIPAACCGLFGLKPGRGRTPSGPEAAEMMHGAAVHGVISRSVRDSALALDVLQGPEAGAPFRVEPPEARYADLLDRPPPALRIGFSTRSPIGAAVHPDCVQAVERTARLLESLGHRVEEAEPALDSLALARDFLSMWFGQIGALVEQVRTRTGRGWDGFELDTRALAALGRDLRADAYCATHARWNTYTRALADFHADHDLLLTPTMAQPPVRIGEIATPAWQRGVVRLMLALRATPLLRASGVVDQIAHENLKYVPYTQLANLTGVPAMSVPLHQGENGLPVGVQFVAAWGGEGLLLRLAAQLERAAPWRDRRPPLG